MSKRIISFFTFGILLIVLGAIFKIMNWQQGTTLLAIGLTFESLAIILYAWNKLKKK